MSVQRKIANTIASGPERPSLSVLLSFALVVKGWWSLTRPAQHLHTRFVNKRERMPEKGKKGQTTTDFIPRVRYTASGELKIREFKCQMWEK